MVKTTLSEHLSFDQAKIVLERDEGSDGKKSLHLNGIAFKETSVMQISVFTLLKKLAGLSKRSMNRSLVATPFLEKLIILRI
jgi:hypothetical protein